mmetsp:Transcript_7496/g.15940  ORF Transcript_7496/g.15940 Transcript_7496/m.15940 type:complete len:209 (+) Transcript_7496:381-1007(+)
MISAFSPPRSSALDLRLAIASSGTTTDAPRSSGIAYEPAGDVPGRRRRPFRCRFETRTLENPPRRTRPCSGPCRGTRTRTTPDPCSSTPPPTPLAAGGTSAASPRRSSRAPRLPPPTLRRPPSPRGPSRRSRSPSRPARRATSSGTSRIGTPRRTTWGCRGRSAPPRTRTPPPRWGRPLGSGGTIRARGLCPRRTPRGDRRWRGQGPR